jgi:phage terminase large subunit-like protein
VARPRLRGALSAQRDGEEALRRRTTSAGRRRDPSPGKYRVQGSPGAGKGTGDIPITLDLTDIAKLEFDLERIAAMSPEEQAYYAPMVRKIDELRRRNPLYFWRPHPGVPLEINKQHLFLSIFKHRKGAVGGNRSGKTTVGIADDLIQACDESFLPPHLLPYKKWEPPFICRIGMQDFDFYGETVIYPKVRELVPRDQLVGGSWENAFSKDLRILRFTNGSIFQFMSYQQDVERFGGAAYHRVHFDEEPPEYLLSEIRRGLIDYGGDELWTMTPLLGLSHSYDELTDDGEPKNNDRTSKSSRSVCARTRR